MSQRFKIGLALGGGAARGIAHLGILRVFESEGLDIDLIAGSSIGAMVGGMYALNPHADALVDRTREYINSDEFKKAKFDFISKAQKTKTEGEGIFYKFSTFLKKRIFYGLAITSISLISEETFDRNITFLLDNAHMDQVKIKLGITALDLNTSEELLITDGSVKRAVMGSTAIPGILPPIKIDHHLCIDGGWSREIPIEDAYAMGADYVIGIDVGSDPKSPSKYVNSLDIVFRANEITRMILKSKRIHQADFIIKPEVDSIFWADFHRIDDCILEGEKAAKANIKALKKDIIRKKRMHSIKNLFKMY